ncbi:Chitin-inducible gibberellin-responsive protein 1 [Hibiscus syriacus]|uniref:Chitin-inducible gibberellin-responsive protein 1 n=1 Tax=Hibiscus syriacus TaxID=106335 RepID=A0A6A2YLA8_HIBSY|nr:Chitin-inducible gibberellin-responsive protein 1 [Hibiscus syriacus]
MVEQHGELHGMGIVQAWAGIWWGAIVILVMLFYMHVPYEICPYLKLGYMAANGAIAEARRTEDRIHIIDFQITQGTQWVTLLQALAARLGGAPHVRITGIDDPASKYDRAFAPDITRDMLNVRSVEALAVNFPLQLHQTPDESVDPLSSQGLAMFKSIDETLPRDKKERINVEQHCLARDIVNIIACEGKERVERHELFGKWKSRLTMAGFRQYPLSSYVNSVIGSLLKRCSIHYTLVEKDGAMLLGWKNRNLISASAWHC